MYNKTRNYWAEDCNGNESDSCCYNCGTSFFGGVNAATENGDFVTCPGCGGRGAYVCWKEGAFHRARKAHRIGMLALEKGKSEKAIAFFRLAKDIYRGE